MEKPRQNPLNSILMKYNLIVVETFKKAAKPLLKKYPSFKDDMLTFFKEMQQNPACGASLGGGIRKIRVALLKKTEGKEEEPELFHTMLWSASRKQMSF